MHIKLFAPALLLATSLSSHAATLIDTGPPSAENLASYSICNDWWCEQSLALQVSFQSRVRIDQVEGWFQAMVPFDFTISLYTDRDGLPGERIASASLTAPSNDREDDGWWGVNSLGWEVASGAYWTTFEVLPGQGFRGGLVYSSPQQLPAAFKYGADGAWQIQTTGNSGSLRIHGEALSPVPEPAIGALALMGALLAMGMRSRSRASS